MNYDIVSLRPLYKLISSRPDVAHLDNRTPIARQYGRLVGRLAKGIDSVVGFYLCGYYEENGHWRNVYLGKAGFGKTTHLRARISEELRDERAALLRTVFTEDEIRASYARNYPNTWHKYERGKELTLRKARSTHIVWVACPELMNNSEVAGIERDLIEALNPTANNSRPVPPSNLQNHTAEILIALRTAIHAHRDDGFQVVLRSDY